jgi:hypothetical protein
MFLQTKIELVNSSQEQLGITPDTTLVNMVLRLSDIVGVRECIVNDKLSFTSSVVILQTGEEFLIETPYSKVVSLLCPPTTFTENIHLDFLDQTTP